MPNLEPGRGVKLLQKQIKRGRKILNSRPIAENDHSSWENTTQDFLTKCFGKGAENVNEFLEKSRPYISGINTDWEQHYAESLKAQIAHLESCTEILLADVEARKGSEARTKIIKKHSQSQGSHPPSSKDVEIVFGKVARSQS